MFLNRHERRRAAALGRQSQAGNSKNQRSHSSSIVTGSIAVGALMLAAPSVAFAQSVLPGGPLGPCVISGTTATCTGDVSDGLDVNTPIDTLNVNNLTQAIMPGAGVDGINFYLTGGDITIDVDTGTYGITTTASATAIYARANGGTVDITSTGDINADGFGIYGTTIGAGNTGVTIHSTGNIVAENDGILGGNYGSSGDVMITNMGDITSNVGNGIFGIRTTGEGDTIINSMGDIQASNDGIQAANYGSGGDVMITNEGNVSSIYSTGILGIRVSGDGDTIIDSMGDIEASNYGIRGANYGSSGDVMITSEGNITSDNSTGILGVRVSGDGDTIIDSMGDIQASGYGIRAANYGSGGDVMITNEGNVTSINSAGIFGIRVSGDGDTIIDSMGDIQASNYGIWGANYGSSGDVMITSVGNVTSDNNTGIRGIRVAGDGDTLINSMGDIQASNYGILGANYGSGGDVLITSVGNVTSDNNFGIRGIRVTGDGDTIINSMGDIQALTDGIYGANSGSNGDVMITSVGNITSNVNRGIYGRRSTGMGDVIIESIGKVSAFVEGIYAINTGLGGDINITSTGNIMSEVSQGIFAGNYSSGGDVTITTSGNITASATGRHAILTRVEPGYQSTINILDGNIQGGAGTGAGINHLSNVGAQNIINTYGAVTISSLGGTAIEGGAGDTTINNWGTLNTVTDGDVLLGAGTNGFNNYAGAVFKPGEIVNLGAGNLFDNHGTFSPGGDGNVFKTELTGQFNQTATGILLTDLDMTANTTDLLNVSETADLSGNVRVMVMNPALGPTQSTILSAAGGTTDNGLGLIASPALQAELSYPNANDVVLSTDLDFTAPGAELNPNQASVAETVSSALGGGGGALDPVILALLNGPTDNPGYQFALDQLGAESVLNQDNAALFGAESFGGQLFSCQVNGEQYAAISEGSCLWVRPIQGRFLDRDRTSTNIGFGDDTFGASVGGQTEFSPDWFAGVALGFENGDLTTDTGVVSDHQSFNGGLSLKHTMGAYAFSGALFGSTSNYDTTRNFTIGGLTATNMSSHNVSAVGARARGAYLHEFGGGAFVKPMVDFSLIHLNRGGFTETGTASTALTIAGTSSTYLSATPAIEFGIDHQTKDNQIVRFYGKAGISIYADDGHSLSGSFANAPAGTAGFVTNTEFDNVFAEVEAGFTFMDDGAATIQLGFQGRYSENSTQSGGFIKANMEF